jgi:hypothetical protein
MCFQRIAWSLPGEDKGQGIQDSWAVGYVSKVCDHSSSYSCVLKLILSLLV